MRADTAGLAVPGADSGDARQAIGLLADGMHYFAPIGQVLTDGTRVTCHLCGREFRSVTAHLQSHGWTKTQYCEAFGLERGQSLEGAETRKLRATAFSARLIFDPALRIGSARGHERARNGDLTRAAAEAARGRAFPAQRRLRVQAGISADTRSRMSRANRQRAELQLATAASEVAAEHGYATIGQLVRDRSKTGQSLAEISRDCGLNKDWLSRHLAQLDPAAAEFARASTSARLDARWLPAIRAQGYDDVASYLRQRHIADHASVNSIANEVGLSFHTVKAALQRHRIAISPHAAKRHTADSGTREAASRLGVDSIANFIQERQALGWTWRQMAAEAGLPESWLRRRK